MKSKVIFILLFAVTLPAQAVQKCTDSDGRITYADFCPSSEPAKVENLYIPDTYDPENHRLTQENIRGMEESTRQSEYDRAQRNARSRQGNVPPRTYTPSSAASKQPSYGTSRTPRTSRSGASFDEQFSDALKSKIDLQKSQAKSGCGANGDCYGKSRSSKGSPQVSPTVNPNLHGYNDANSNQEERSSSQEYWDGYDDAKSNQADWRSNTDYQGGYDDAKREQEQEQRQKEIQRQMLQ